MSQYEMHAIEALGLLKFDFLGLSNLTILRQAVDLVRANRGIEIDLDAIPLDDATTFELLASGETTGVFQLESAGMRRYVRDLRPTSVYDLAAMVALYRPGPMDNIPAYIRRKHGQEPVTYLHPLLEPYLEKTYGIFVYQEDIMSAAIALGGFTGPEADTLGYAIRKKKSAVLRAQKEKFVTQAAERGRRAAGHRRRLQGVRAVRALRLQQGARHLLRPDRLPDRVHEGEPHGRLHDRGADRLPLERGEGRGGRRRMPPDGRSRSCRRTSTRAISSSPSRATRSGSGCWRSRTSARARSSRSSPRATRAAQFRSLTDFCTRIDLRLANRKVLEALAKVGALEPVRPPGPDPARARRRGRGRRRRPSATGSAGRPRCSTSAPPTPSALERPLPDRDRGPRPRAAALGEGAARAVPLGAPDGRGRRARRAVRDRLLERPARRIARRPAGRRRRDRDRRPDRHHQGQVDDGDRDPRGPPGHDRGRRLPAALRTDAGSTWRDGEILLVAGRVDHKSEEVSLLADLARRLGRGRGRRRGGLRAAGGRRRSWRWRRGAAAANGTGYGSGTWLRAPRGRDRWPGRSSRSVPGQVGHGRRDGGRPAPSARPGAARSRSSRRGAAGQSRRRRPPTALPADRPRRTRLDLSRTRRASAQRVRIQDDEPSVPGRGARPDRRRRDRRRPGRRRSRTRPSTSGSPAARRPIAWSGRWRRSRRSCATGRARPGSSSTCRHPAAARSMELRRGVAYDAELLAEVRRRLGDGLVELRLASA